ncbi:5704_t:CDS:2 [Funneliformis caledonium]|uniref:5704_t:CDS:1 n=1 Tax=Funneliformis caledonium TaxID=1117310 RepID=A0A9N9NN69_9GLOM|nr:5704_t:CDS:2 [Funneliformis caledonium]
MPRLTSRQKQSRRAYKINNIKVNNDDVSAHDGSVYNDSEGYEYDLKDYFEVDNGSSHYNSIDDEPVENDNAASIIEKLREATRKRKNQQQREAVKGTLTLHTFWDTKKPSEEIDEKLTEENVKESDDEIEDCDWHNKIQIALKNLILDLKKEKVNSEIWIHINSIQLYLQLIKSNYLKIDTSEIVANAARKGANDYIMTHKILYSCRGYHTKVWSFFWDEDIILQVKAYIQEYKWDVTPQILMA